MTNPLLAKHRVPRLYCSLPTGLQFYPPGAINVSANNEVAVYPLTVKDQILLKTPDALLNGETLMNIVRSCVPDVRDPNILVEPDINTLLVAIRAATTGPTWDWSCNCPSCEKELDFQFNLPDILDTQTPTELDPTIVVQDEYIIKVRPFSFKQRNMSLLNEIEENKAKLTLANKGPNIDAEQQALEMTQLIDKITTRLLELVSMSIISVTVKSTNQVVTDANYIKEFVFNLSKSEADAISSKIKDINSSGINTKSQFKCEYCKHEWEQDLDLDPTSFFD
jgi:hypothetical protein